MKRFVTWQNDVIVDFCANEFLLIARLAQSTLSGEAEKEATRAL